MRIGIDVRCLAEGKRTGVEEYTLALLRELFESDKVNQYVLFYNAWQGRYKDFSWIEPYGNVELKVFRFPNKLLNLCLWYLHFPKLDKLIGGVDIFFLPNLNFVAVSKEAKLVVTAHDLSFEKFPETFSWKQRIWHFFVNFRDLAKRADHIISVSDSTKDDLVTEYKIVPEKVSVIHSGIDERFRNIDRNNTELLRIKQKYSLPYKFILFLGTFEPRKNIVALLQAYDALMEQGNTEVKKYELVLAGTRGWKYQEIFQAIENSAHKEKIHLPGFIEDDDKVAVYNLSSVFVYPSLYEGFGFPPLEAMSCGVPVISSHASSLPEIIGTAGIMIDPYQPDELLKALLSLTENNEFSGSLQKKGLLQAKKFSWQKAADETRKVFEKLAE